MKEFMLKTVTLNSDDGHTTAKRSRSTEGYASIALTVSGNTIEFSFAEFGEDYEQVAKGAADALAKIADNPCLLPKN